MKSVRTARSSPAGKVPSFLPGKNDVLSEFATEYGIPLEAALGGAETLYPEYIKKMKTMKVAPRTTTEHSDALSEASNEAVS